MGLSIWSDDYMSMLGSSTNNPNPRNFEIKDYYEYEKYLVLKVHYPDCSNFEGMKISVYKGLTVKDLFGIKFLDPHFCKIASNGPAPIARFIPTDEGWEQAKAFVRMLADACNNIVYLY